MIHITHYNSPIGNLLLASQDNKLIGLWIEGQKYYLSIISDELIEKKDEVLNETILWLNAYFNGDKPNIHDLEMKIIGSDFRKRVLEILTEIPYGKTVTYNDIAKRIAEEKGIEKMSAQAVGGAVGHNPISIIIPCHRVIGSNNNLTGYSGGIEKKIFLLNHEKVDINNFTIPK